MLRSPFFWKVYLGFLTVILLAAGLSGWLFTAHMGASLHSHLQRTLESEVLLISRIVEPLLQHGELDDTFQQQLVASSRRSGIRLTIIDPKGRVLADSHREDPASMENHYHRPELRMARATPRQTGTSVRLSQTVDYEQIYVALLLYDQDQPLGYVRASIPVDSVNQDLRSALGLIAGIALLSALASLGISALLSRRVTHPLATIAESAEEVARGGNPRDLPHDRTDEIGAVARAVAGMARRLHERMQTITTDRNKLLAILRGMNEGVVAIDGEERVVHMNAVAGRILMARPDNSVGRRIWEVTRVREVSQILSNVLQQDHDARGTLRQVSRPRDREVEMHAAPLRNSQGALAGAVVVLHDVSELRRLESVRRDFVANVSHELKTPITAIRGLVETLFDDEMPGEMRYRFLDKVRSQAERLSALVQDLLTLARLESQEDVLEMDAVDMCDPIHAAGQALQHVAEEKGVDIQVELPKEPAIIAGDEEALRQIATNLLDNALKYTAPGGRIWLRLRVEDEEVVLEVEDTGIGIEPRHLHRIFERFYRVDKARSREVGGTGLGLSIVKHMAKLHAGEVTVESVPGRGSTFRVHLPLAPQPV
jgi:two-component system phosphate regulon sensor histidine kinase PhoR